MRNFIKKLIIVFLISALLTVATLFCSGCEVEQVLTESDRETTQYLDSSAQDIATCTPNESLFALVYNVQRLQSYCVSITGKVEASLTTQKIEGAKYKSGDSALYVSRSTSTFKNTANKIFVQGDTVLFRNGNAKTNVYEDECAKFGYDDYIKEYGTDFRAISNYDLNENTILKSELLSAENGIYTYRYEIDVNKGVNGYRVNMRKIGNLGDYPTFTKSTLTVSITENFMPVSIVQQDEYTVKMLFNVSCVSEITSTYERLNDLSVAIPEYDFYTSQLGD